MKREIVAILRCPATGQRLFLADPELLAAIPFDLGDEPGETLTAALVCVDGSRAYPVIADIPKLLVDAASELSLELQHRALQSFTAEHSES